MKITVVLCTYNRCQSLKTILNCLGAQTVSEAMEWEVLVVDNNSSDETRLVAEEFCRQFPGRFRYLFERHPGKSYALNAGVRESRSEVLAFIDDDVTVEATWLQNLTAPLQNRKWAGSGGPVILRWTYPAPRWLALDRPYSLGPLAAFNPGIEAGEFHEPPFGTNMAFRKSMFEKYGLFRVDLGPSPDGDTPRPNEDTEFGRRVLAGGERLRYEPAAIVYHPVPESRLQKTYFLKWWFDKGRAEIREFGGQSGTMRFYGVPVSVLRRLAVWALRWIVAIRPHRRFECRLKVSGKLGEVSEYRRNFKLRHNHKDVEGAARSASRP